MMAISSAALASGTSLVFRLMEKQDLVQVLAAEQQIYPYPWTAGNFSDSLASQDRAWTVWQDGQLCGYAVVMITLDEAQLLNISILPRLQGRGLGAALLRHVMADAKERGARLMLLEVRLSNLVAQAMYQHFGFARIGLRKGYYPAMAGREDALVMCCELLAGIVANTLVNNKEQA